MPARMWEMMLGWPRRRRKEEEAGEEEDDGHEAVDHHHAAHEVVAVDHVGALVAGVHARFASLCLSVIVGQLPRPRSFPPPSPRAALIPASASPPPEPTASTDAGANNNLPKNRRDILLEYVKGVQPEFMELFVKRAPTQVVDAMRHTVTNMIGTLPPQFFAVTVTTVAENLAQLMYSVLMTGYMFRNAQYRLELQQSLSRLLFLNLKKKSSAVRTLFAMNAFIKRLLAVGPCTNEDGVSETSGAQLANLLFWLMIVGYMRNIEVRFDMERVLGAAPKMGGELPPGPGDNTQTQL
ncbi:hypothetical protein ZWY2020_023973 [Hordeum vulgare]|nr:hypothetical protein ZWY2020_023973 [Hordeum vulgare]